MSRVPCVLLTLLALLLLPGCESDGRDQTATAESCMKCHNGSRKDDYAGPGLENPHPFGIANNLRCTVCHGGNPNGSDKASSHVPPPPEIGDRENLERDRKAYFNRLTLTGIDKFPDYTVSGTTHTGLDYLQFVNPGDLRVVTQSRACGQCHEPHGEHVNASVLATEAGILSSANYAMGVDNAIPENSGLHQDTAADLAFRAVADDNYVMDPAKVGTVRSLLEFPVHSVHGQEGPDKLFRNENYTAASLDGDVEPDNTVMTGSRLAQLFQEQVAFTCGDCHLGSAGANNRYGDFRSSGCTACHMPYSLDGRSRSRDPNVDKNEPLDPDDIDEPERSHVRSHRIASVAKTLPGGETQQGIDDYACAGCHQGSNRTVMQYWGIRLDQNQDLRRDFQYPANPISYENTSGDERLFDPEVRNRTFNGRNANQYILFEDYDGDGRDDTPADVHYEAGLGCIDCHGSWDLHGGDVNDPSGARILSRMEQSVAIRCESCHGSVDAYAQTTNGSTYDGRTAELAVDGKGYGLRHVVKESDGNYYLYSRLTGNRHFVTQTKDTVVDSGKVNPLTQQPLFSVSASYAMGRCDGDPATGIGPKQTQGCRAGFSHTDNMSCASCHAAWTNTCTGCHLEGEYNTGNNFSNITGDRIVFREKFAEFVYQSPVPFQLGVGPDGKIRQFSPNSVTFFRYEDLNNDRSRVFAFTDRSGGGNNPASPYPSLSHNAMMAHSIRGKVTTENEGPRYCVSCHLTQEGIATFGAEYDAFRAAMANNDFGALNFPRLKQHIGQNPGNQLNSPLWVHMVAGLGSGLYLFDANGCAVNPLDQNPDRYGCDGVAPANRIFDPGRVAFNLDRIVDENGVSTASNKHPFMYPAQGPPLRDGAQNPMLSGPLGGALVRKLTDPIGGVVLDSYLDANGQQHGDPSNFVRDP